MPNKLATFLKKLFRSQGGSKPVVDKPLDLESSIGNKTDTDDTISYNSLYDWFPVEKAPEHLLLSDNSGRLFKVAHEDCESVYGDHVNERHSIEEVVERFNFAVNSDATNPMCKFQVTDDFELELRGTEDICKALNEGSVDKDKVSTKFEFDSEVISKVEQAVEKNELTNTEILSSDGDLYNFSCFNYYQTIDDLYPSDCNMNA